MPNDDELPERRRQQPIDVRTWVSIILAILGGFGGGSVVASKTSQPAQTITIQMPDVENRIRQMEVNQAILSVKIDSLLDRQKEGKK